MCVHIYNLCGQCNMTMTISIYSYSTATQMFDITMQLYIHVVVGVPRVLQKTNELISDHGLD